MMEGLIFSEDICRLCLWKSNKLFSIFSSEGELQEIPQKIEMCLPISVTREDVLPKLICSQCLYKLEMFSEFRNSCVRSEQLLKRYMSHEPVQVPACHSVFVQMQEEVKVEVHESDPIALEQEIPFFVIPDHIHKEATREYEPPKVENQSVTSIHVDAAEIENSNKDATSLKKQAKRNQRAVRWNPAPKKRRNESELLAVCVDPPNHGQARRRGSVREARSLALTSSMRSVHRCKHCSKNFPSRVHLSQHLSSSNCLFRYTCRYCAKIFNTVESRISHERNHRGKKNFICRICKHKFQSSFDLNVHTLQGCEHRAVHSHRQSTVITEANQQMPQEKDIQRKNETKQLEGILNQISVAKAKRNLKCKYCTKDFTHTVPNRNHVHTCRHVMDMSKINEVTKKNLIKSTHKSVSLKVNQGSFTGNQKTKHKIQNRVLPGGTQIKALSRRKPNPVDSQEATALEHSSARDHFDLSLKASLLAVVGLKEKSEAPDLKTTQKADEMKISKANSDVTEDEVVTVCDICWKIFTSESGMLNHQTTVHNRNLTAEKINSLMRVEV